MRLGVLLTRVRTDERLMIEALEASGCSFDLIDLRHAVFLLGQARPACDIVINRSIGQTEGLSAVQYYESMGCIALNKASVISCCGDKAAMSLSFQVAGLPTPLTAICYTPESALAASREIGFPVVLKPVIGSWGRLVVRLNDEEAAKSTFLYKASLKDTHQKIFYLQKYIEKPGRDIRVIVMGTEIVAAYYRSSDHWITNVKLGAVGKPMQTTPSLERLAIASAAAVGGGVLGVDLLETADGELLVNEVNHTPEFTEAYNVTGIDIAGRYLEYARSALW